MKNCTQRKESDNERSGSEHYLIESIHSNLFNKYIKLEKQTPHLSMT